MPRLLLALLLLRQAAADNICASSDNANTNSDLECKYLSPCTADVVPAEPAGYFIECETMPCDDDQDIMFDKIEGTDVGVLFDADCATTVEACAGACEATLGCCGFNFVWNPGQYASTQLGRCVAKACDGRIGTSRYGMVYYSRTYGAVTAAPTTASPSAAPTTLAPTPRPTAAPTSADDDDDDSDDGGCVASACREDTGHSDGLDSDCCGVNALGSSTYCADGYDYFWDLSSDRSTCEAYSELHHRTCCVPVGAARPANAGDPTTYSSDDDDGDDDDAVVLVGIGCATVVALCLVAGGAYVAARRRSPREPAAAHPTKDAASPTVDMHDIRWATPRASGPVAGGAPNPMAVA
jgi:hypothetical protein